MSPPTTHAEPVPQYLRALKAANHIRLTRAARKRTIHALPTDQGLLAALATIDEPPPEFTGMEISELLGSVRRYGTSRVGKLLARVPISESKPLGQVTDRQRGALHALLCPPAETAGRQEFIAPDGRRIVVLPTADPPRAFEHAPAPAPTRHMWCPNCSQDVLARTSGTCGWCGHKTQPAAAA